MNRNTIYYIIIAGLIILLFWRVFTYCEPSGNSGQLPASKQEIARNKQERDSIIFRVDTVVKERIKYVTRYKEVRHDSLIPCETKLLHCDTLVVKDSVAIAELQALVKQDNLIITQQGKLINAQDSTIIDLTKKVKREKRRTRFVAVIAGILAGIAIAK
jgi:hypothetical protein